MLFQKICWVMRDELQNGRKTLILCIFLLVSERELVAQSKPQVLGRGSIQPLVLKQGYIRVKDKKEWRKWRPWSTPHTRRWGHVLSDKITHVICWQPSSEQREVWIIFRDGGTTWREVKHTCTCAYTLVYKYIRNYTSTRNLCTHIRNTYAPARTHFAHEYTHCKIYVYKVQYSTVVSAAQHRWEGGGKCTMKRKHVEQI